MSQRTMLHATLLLLTALASACAAPRGNVFPLPQGYTRPESLLQRLQAIAEIRPDLVRLHVLGFSGTENLPLYALEIGSQAASRGALLIGQHHGDEILGLEIVLAWAQELAATAGSDKKTDAILSQYRFWIFPTLNPEGWRVVGSGLYQNKRKNNRDTNLNGKLDLHSDGVDLNRNYPVFWDEDPPQQPGHQNYKGPSPASEPEIQALLALAQKHDFALAVFYHSSPTGSLAEKVFLPALNEQNARQKERYDSLRAVAEGYAQSLKRDYLRGTYEIGNYPGSRVGNARNYFFHIRETPAFLVEVGGVNKDGISVIHPPAKKKDQIVNKHVKALRRLFSEPLPGPGALAP